MRNRKPWSRYLNILIHENVQIDATGTFFNGLDSTELYLDAFKFL